jgi:predicted extracellular nuclease
VPWGELRTDREGFEPSKRFKPFTRSPGVRLQPLGHLSRLVARAQLSGAFWARQRGCARAASALVGIALSTFVAACGPAIAQGDPALEPVPAIQGPGPESPMAGREVVTDGIVTAVADDGFYLQDPAGDGDLGTSDAVFVQTSARPEVDRGHRVRVRATVTEAAPPGSPEGLRSTRLVNPTRIEVMSRGRPLRAAAVLGSAGRAAPRGTLADALAFFESLEGMLVSVPRVTALGPTVRRGGGRADFFTALDLGRERARTAAGGLLLRSGPDNRGDQNYDRVRVAFDPVLSGAPPPALATGDVLGAVTGVLDYAYGAFQIRPTEPVAVSARAAWRAEVTRLTRTPDRLTIATYNVLNLSADSSDEAQRRRLGEQIARALHAPDIVALQEIQDSSGERDDGVVDGRPTLRALAAAVQEGGGPAYAYVEVAPADGRQGGAPGGNIRNAYLYDTARVILTGHRSLTPELLAGAGAPDGTVFAESRDPLEATFEFAGRRLVVINNHLTSRFGSTPVFGAVQPWVQAGEAERAAQVRALRTYAGALVARDPNAALVVLGDMNTFEFTDDLSHLLPGDPPLLTNLVPRIPAAERYTYVFEGNSQVLDHIFVTANLAAAAEVDIVHLNVDFPAEPEASDHDPVVARLRW